MDSIRGLVIAAVIIAIVVVGGVFLYAQPKGKSTNTPSTQQQVAPTTQVQMSTAEVITLTKDGFSPASLTVKVGTRVKWVNGSGELAALDSNPHPVHTSYPPLNFGAFSNGSSVELVFDKPGTYGYHNHLNPSQTGTVVVQ